jgi:hypothetical protein
MSDTGIKRPLSAFFLFSTNRRADVKIQHPEYKPVQIVSVKI